MASKQELEAQQALIEEGARIEAALQATEERKTYLNEMKAQSIRDMHSAGISWAAIARTFKVSPQAVMYASGLVTRTAKPKR